MSILQTTILRLPSPLVCCSRRLQGSSTLPEPSSSSPEPSSSSPEPASTSIQALRVRFRQLIFGMEYIGLSASTCFSPCCGVVMFGVLGVLICLHVLLAMLWRCDLSLVPASMLFSVHARVCNVNLVLLWLPIP